VGIAAGLTFAGAELTLGPGDALFLYTDGVTEAHDPDDQLFGEERLLEHLSRNAAAEPRILAEGVRAAVAGFARGAPQFDDIAILVVRRPLRAGQNDAVSVEDSTQAVETRRALAASTLEVPATTDGLAAASRWLGGWCAAQEVAAATMHDLDLALDELVANVIRHGYGGGGPGTVRLFLDLVYETVRLEIRDSAAAFDPLSAPGPGKRAEAGGGGLGIELVRRSMGRLAYVRENGENRVILERRKDGGAL
jgi:sigma-B regulation protein RsbU (phosphoserine phosphatase)